MSIATFQQEIEESVNKKVKLRINDNRFTMLSVKWESQCTKVSMHRMFLEAPKDIMDAVSSHIQTENSSLCYKVREFIEERLAGVDYSFKVDEKKWTTQGKVYDLKAFYDEINADYFEGHLNLKITWYGKIERRKRSQVTFGLYQDTLKLVKIHRMMDSTFFPEYFVKFVIYHEMLHHVCRSQYDEKGRHSIHTEEFKRLEQQFKDFEKAEEWMERNYNHFFSMQREHGRS